VRGSPLLTLLRAACQGREDLPLATFDAAHLQWALESGLGPLLFHATKHDPKAATSPFWPLLQGADLTGRCQLVQRPQRVTYSSYEHTSAHQPL
jgi:hypothetical protein